ncbi:unnamed protein product [Polarella glacialis]|uniref:Uncharacterized protein n=1 Tax=Polarella glacialis TaxID=89957 RepID=A0A813LY45_POLGL|nr:unnamed protein product [Polarella glacialis]
MTDALAASIHEIIHFRVCKTADVRVPRFELQDFSRVQPVNAGAKSAAVVSEKGEFRGMISRNGLIEVVRRLEEAHDNRKFDDDTLDEDEEESSLVIPR